MTANETFNRMILRNRRDIKTDIKVNPIKSIDELRYMIQNTPEGRKGRREVKNNIEPKDDLTFDQEVFGVAGTCGYEFDNYTKKYKRIL